MSLAVLLLLLIKVGSGTAQEIQLEEGTRPAGSVRVNHVSLLTDSVEVAAGRPQTVELRFRVDPGFHINSHTPKDELLIPTSLTFQGAVATRVLGTEFPKGTPFRLNIGSGELLDVYQGEFRVTLKLAQLAAGTSDIIGTLRYQACDSAACFPPRLLPVRIALAVR